MHFFFFLKKRQFSSLPTRILNDVGGQATLYGTIVQFRLSHVFATVTPIFVYVLAFVLFQFLHRSDASITEMLNYVLI